MSFSYIAAFNSLIFISFALIYTPSPSLAPTWWMAEKPVMNHRAFILLNLLDDGLHGLEVPPMLDKVNFKLFSSIDGWVIDGREMKNSKLSEVKLIEKHVHRGLGL